MESVFQLVWIQGVCDPGIAVLEGQAGLERAFQLALSLLSSLIGIGVAARLEWRSRSPGMGVKTDLAIGAPAGLA